MKKKSIINTNAEEIESSLTAIYQDEGGKNSGSYKTGSQEIPLVVVRFVCWNGVRDRPRRRGVGRFFFFKPFRGFTGQGLEIQIEGPEKVSLGQETTYFINYRNRTSEPIASAQFV